MVDIDTSPVSPVCDRLVELLKSDILQGNIKYGERLQTEKWLTNKYNVSRTTLRKAVSILISQGYLERRPSAGIFVAYFNTNLQFDKPTSIHQRLQQSGLNPHSKILYYKLITAEDNYASIFKCKPGEILLAIHRLRYSDDTPFAIQILYLREKYFPNFNPWKLRDNSFHSILNSDYNMSISKTEQLVNVCVADKYLAENLEIPLRTPLLLTTSTMTIKPDIIVEYQLHYLNTNVVPYAYKVNNYK